MIDMYSPFLISVLTGWFFCSLLFARAQYRIPPGIKLFLGAGLGLGINAVITFGSFLIFDRFHKSFILTGSLVILAGLITGSFLMGYRPRFTVKEVIYNGVLPVTVIIAFSIPLWLLSHFYAYGGWDAWQTWNFKAKMLFLGGDHWQNMFDPLLFRSSPHYPILLPLINVWGWIFTADAPYQVTVFTSYFFTLSSISLLFFTLKELTKTNYAFLAALVLLTSPLINMLSLSQYADNVVGFYLLASMACLMIGKERASLELILLAGIFIGLLSFSKAEGFLAAGILVFWAVPYLLYKNPAMPGKKLIIGFLAAAVLSFIPGLIFKWGYATENLTFINGLTSPDQPITLLRIKNILAFYFFELATILWDLFIGITKGWNAPEIIPAKWNCLWLLLLAGLMFSNKKAFNRKTIIFPAFFLSYFGVITVYYVINTYFPIEWWLQVTLHRILFAVLPTAIFWIFYALWQDHHSSKNIRKDV